MSDCFIVKEHATTNGPSNLEDQIKEAYKKASEPLDCPLSEKVTQVREIALDIFSQSQGMRVYSEEAAQWIETGRVPELVGMKISRDQVPGIEPFLMPLVADCVRQLGMRHSHFLVTAEQIG